MNRTIISFATFVTAVYDRRPHLISAVIDRRYSFCRCALVVLLANLCLAGICQAQSMFRGDANHSGTYAGSAPHQFHRVKWKFPTGNRIVSSPVIYDKTIYFGGDDGNVYAVDAETGRQVWKHATKGPVSSTPAVAGGIVYATSYDGKLYALNAGTGALKWKFATEGERRFEAKGLDGMEPKNQTIADPFDVFLSSPVVVQGTVYFGSGDGNLYAVDAVTGDLRWKFKTGDVVHASPAYADGVLFFGSWEKTL
jgi:outer membrane protein assembly factor BamB